MLVRLPEPSARTGRLFVYAAARWRHTTTRQIDFCELRKKKRAIILYVSGDSSIVVRYMSCNVLSWEGACDTLCLASKNIFRTFSRRWKQKCSVRYVTIVKFIIYALPVFFFYCTEIAFLYEYNIH